MPHYKVGFYIRTASYFRIYYTLIEHLLKSNISILVNFDNYALYSQSKQTFTCNSSSEFKHLLSLYELPQSLSQCQIYFHEGINIDLSLLHYLRQNNVMVVSSCLHFLDGLISPPDELVKFDKILLPSSKFIDYHKLLVTETYQGNALKHQLKCLEALRDKAIFVGSPIFDQSLVSNPICERKSSKKVIFFPQSHKAHVGKISSIIQLSNYPLIFKFAISLLTFNYKLLTKINTQYSIIHKFYSMLSRFNYNMIVKSRDKHVNPDLYSNLCKSGIEVVKDFSLCLDYNKKFTELVSKCSFVLAVRSFAAVESVFNERRAYLVDIQILDTLDYFKHSPYFLNYVKIMRSSSHPIWNYPGVIEPIKFKNFSPPKPLSRDKFNNYCLDAWGLYPNRNPSFIQITDFILSHS